MKDLCSHNCCATRGAMYVTPWCSLLRDKECNCSVLHLWYSLSMLQEEIDKRSSYLGKFRRTEEAAHLLDLIRMSKDETDLFIPFAKAAMADVSDALRLYMPKRENGYWWREGTETLVFTDVPALPDPALNFYAGQYVEFKGKLYMAIEDGDTDDFGTKIVPTEDYRNSIHFGILWDCSYNPNVIEPLDVAVFEALVARILYKWLVMAYPDEAARYNAEYEEHLLKIRDRARALQNVHIIDRILRPF